MDSDTEFWVKREERRRRLRKIILRQMIISITTLWRHKQPKRTSPLGGAEYVDQLRVIYDGHSERIQEVLCMPDHTFSSLVNWLEEHKCLRRSRKGVTVDQKLAIFLHIAAHGNSSRQAQERYQHSGETITRYDTNRIFYSTHTVEAYD
jgi:hypothetical protein